MDHDARIQRLEDAMMEILTFCRRVDDELLGELNPGDYERNMLVLGKLESIMTGAVSHDEVD